MVGDLTTAAWVVDTLQRWLSNTKLAMTGNSGTGDEGPFASLYWTPHTMSILIDDLVVWCSEDNTTKELTFEFCRSAFIEYINSLQCYKGGNLC